MARITTEDCTDKIPNRFDLVLLANHRAKMISAGAPITVNRDNDKNSVVALREIAESNLAIEDLREDLIHSLQRQVETDEIENTNKPETPNKDSGSSIKEESASNGNALTSTQITEEDIARDLERINQLKDRRIED